MDGRYRMDAELESLRRSLVMMEANQLALTRDQALALVGQLIAARDRLSRLTNGLDDRHADRQATFSYRASRYPSPATASWACVWWSAFAAGDV